MYGLVRGRAAAAFRPARSDSCRRADAVRAVVSGRCSRRRAACAVAGARFVVAIALPARRQQRCCSRCCSLGHAAVAGAGGDDGRADLRQLSRVPPLGVSLTRCACRGAAPLTRAHAASSDTRLPIIVLVQVALVLVADPRGNFPLNDDWAYAHSVRWLFDEHRIRLSDWIAMNLLPQTLMGGAAVAIAGYSFAVLRHLTQVVSIGVALLAFAWFEAAGLRRRDALVATLVGDGVAGLEHSVEFVHDGSLRNAVRAAGGHAVPSRARASSWRNARRRDRAGGNRHAAAAGRRGASGGVSRRNAGHRTGHGNACRAARAVLPLAAVFAAEFAYRSYLVHGPGMPGSAQTTTLGHYFDRASGKLVGEMPVTGAGSGRSRCRSQFYLGLFVAPWLAFVGFGADPKGRRAVLLAAAAIAVGDVRVRWFPPWRENNVIDAAGIGPFTLYDAIPRGLAALDRSPGSSGALPPSAPPSASLRLARVICAPP